MTQPAPDKLPDAKPPPRAVNCPKCGGEGMVVASRMTMVYRVCKMCRGTGVVVK